MRIAKIQRKICPDVLKVSELFRECEKNKERIVDFEYEYAKWLLTYQNAHGSYQYLISMLGTIKAKCDQMYKETKAIWLPERIFEKSALLSIELQIKIDQRNP